MGINGRAAGVWIIILRIIVFFLVIHLLTNTVYADKLRVIVSTDIGGSDSDDFQSMVHFLVYTDVFDVEGIISSPPGAGRKSHIIEVLNEYAKDYNNLKTYGNYPSYDTLLALTKQGAISPGAPGNNKSTEGSNLIIQAAKKIDPRPLWVLVWGSITDIAQALYDDLSIKDKIRVYYIGSSNTSQDPDSRNYIYNNHSDLWWIENDVTFRGMYTGGNQSGDLGNGSFVQTHVKGHGNLGNFFYNKRSFLKMGDTPSVLYLLAPLVGGVGNLDNPTSESWGGQFRRTNHGANYWTDVTDIREQDIVSVHKWREQYLRDWEKRMDRCATPKPNADAVRPSPPFGLAVQ